MENQNSKNNHKELKRLAKISYDTVGSVESHHLKSKIVFNSVGFRHLVWQGKTPRRRREQIRRFALLPYAAGIIKNPIGKIEYRTGEELSKTKWHHKKMNGKSVAQFWGFVGKVDGKRVKVIVRQVGKGEKHFFSIF